MTSTSTINSTINGKAYEYACILAFKEIVGPIRPIEVINNKSLEIAKRRYEDDITSNERANMLSSARAGINTIITMEPKIIEDGKDMLTVSIQADNVASSGDVRDILVIRRSIQWEIGVSVKHNHEALKHSRLATNLDFGNSWYGVPCDQSYFDAIRPLFDELSQRQERGEYWRDMPNKDIAVYIPILNAFMTELARAERVNSGMVVSGLIKYLLGSNGSDYYKLIHHNNHTVRVVPYNLENTLNQSSSTQSPDADIPAMTLPTRIIDLSLKENSNTTAILTMDNGWAISFRIHNASSLVEPSLKFDIQLVGQPSNLFFIDVAW